MPGPGGSDGELVLLTVCHSVVESTVLRSALEAHDIFCFVQGEHHRQLLGTFGQYVDLRVLVPRGQLDEARALLADLRANPPALAERDDAADDDAPAQPRLSEASALRRALVPALGGGHLYAGAPVRGALLMAAQIFGLVVAFSWGEPLVGLATTASAVAFDAYGARRRIRKAQPLPRATTVGDGL